MEEDRKDLSLEASRSALYNAIQLIGNASANISCLKCKKMLKALNSNIHNLADKDSFKDAAPNLFGQGFKAKTKERAESIKLLSAVKPWPPLRNFLSKGPSQCSPKRRRPFQQKGENWLKRDKHTAK